MSGMVGIPSGFNALDQSTGGWEDGTLIILAARPGMGKTAAMLQMAVYPALHLKVPTGIFSIEMPRTQISMRMMAQESGIDINKISGKSSNKMNEMAIDDLDSKCKLLYEAPIFLDDTPSLSLRSFRSKARKMVSKNGVKLLLVDYLQLMDSEINGSREQQVSKISSTLKAVAKELNVPIIALSSLNRSVEARPDKRPQLQDLRDSGAIESDADMVIFIYRPEYYGLQEFNNQSSHGVALFTIAKHRGGELGDIQLKWEGYKTKFSDNTFDFAEPHKLEPDEAF
jgi:replicative DNA helicase